MLRVRTRPWEKAFVNGNFDSRFSTMSAWFRALCDPLPRSIYYGLLSLLVNSGSKFVGFVGCMSKVLKIGLNCLKQSCKLRHTSTFEGRGSGGRDRVSMSQLRTRTGKIDGLWNLRLPLELQVAMKLKWFQHPGCQAARPNKQTNWVLDVLKFGYARFLSLCFLCRTPIHHVRESRTWRTCCTDTPQHFTGQSLNSLQHQWKYSHRMSTNACSQFVSWIWMDLDRAGLESTMWGPPVISWFISPSNYSYVRTINHSYGSYKPT